MLHASLPVLLSLFLCCFPPVLHVLLPLRRVPPVLHVLLPLRRVPPVLRVLLPLRRVPPVLRVLLPLRHSPPLPTLAGTLTRRSCTAVCFLRSRCWFGGIAKRPLGGSSRTRCAAARRRMGARERLGEGGNYDRCRGLQGRGGLPQERIWGGSGEGLEGEGSRGVWRKGGGAREPMIACLGCG
eukprot:42781-Chlamydomonas_euryale.AAC.1